MADAEHGGGGHSPLEQFEIKRIVPLDIGGLDLSFTNSSLFMVLAVAIASAFLILGIGRGALVPGRWQSMAELSYEFIANLIRENKVFLIDSSIQTGKKFGMQLLDDHIYKLWKKGLVTQEDCLAKCNSPEELAARFAAAERGIFDDDPDESD